MKRKQRQSKVSNPKVAECERLYQELHEHMKSLGRVDSGDGSWVAVTGDAPKRRSDCQNKRATAEGDRRIVASTKTVTLNGEPRWAYARCGHFWGAKSG